MNLNQYGEVQREGQDGDTADSGSVAESIGNQRNILSKKRLLIALPSLSLALFVSFFDQTGVSTAVPVISDELDTGTGTSWIGASFLVAATAFQLINGRLSDIFGRKNLLLLCLGLLGLGDLLCGFSQSANQLFVFRAIAGVGGGGVNSITMIIVSDVTTLEERGKWQGLLGAMIALANGVGPFVGGALVDKASWRWIFWIIPMTAIPAAVSIHFFLPLRHDRGNYLAKIKMIDYGGIVLNLAASLLIMIPLSGGGVTYAWDSTFVISTLTIGGFLAIVFVLYEWKIASIPIMPLRLFEAPHTSSLYLQSFLTGNGMYGNFFYLPIYFQIIRSYSALESGALLLPLVILNSIGSIAAGQFMSRLYHYLPPITIGFAMWVLAAGIRVIFDENTSLGTIICITLVEGLGIGLTLQSTMVALLANSHDGDRAVVTGLRNFLRTIGGAFGLTVSGSILSNTLTNELSYLTSFSTSTDQGDLIGTLTSATYSLKELGLTAAQEKEVITAYVKGLKYVFIYYAVSAGLCLLICGSIGNTSLKTKKHDNYKGVSDEESGLSSEKNEARADSSTGASNANKLLVSGGSPEASIGVEVSSQEK